jgi:hypothetical protein
MLYDIAFRLRGSGVGVRVGVGLDVGTAAVGVEMSRLDWTVLVTVGRVGSGVDVTWDEAVQAVTNMTNIDTMPARRISPSPLPKVFLLYREQGAKQKPNHSWFP